MTRVYTKYLFYFKKIKYNFLKKIGIYKESMSFYMSKNEISSLEISVKVGCGLFCTYCPQDNYIEKYKKKYPTDNKLLSIEVFEMCMKNISKNTHIKWSGFTESLDNKFFPYFCEYLKNNGYRQSISTTLKGGKGSVEWFLNNMEIFDKVTFHLPDGDDLMKCKVDQKYIKNLKKALSGPTGNGWNERENKKRMSVHLIGNRFNYDVNSVVNSFIKSGKINKSQIIKAKVLNTRNSSIGEQEINLDHISFRDESLVARTDDIYYCAYRRLNQGVLLPNGNVSLCCQDFSLEYILGNLIGETLDDLYIKIQSSKEESEYFVSGAFFPCTKCEHYKKVEESFTGHLRN